MKSFSTFLATAVATVFSWGTAAYGAAFITAATGSIVDPDSNDAFQGATILNKSLTWSTGNPGGVQDSAADMFGTVTNHGRPGMTRFGGTTHEKIWNGGSSVLGPYDGINFNPPFVEFSTVQPVTIGGVRMTSSAVGGGNAGHHSIVRFRLYGSNDGGTTYGVLLSDVLLYEMPQADQAFNWNNPNYVTEFGGTDIVLTDYFDAPVTYQFFRAEFHVTNRNPNDFTIGEIDALPVPEPTSLAGLGMGAGSLLLRRRRGSECG